MRKIIERFAHLYKMGRFPDRMLQVHKNRGRITEEEYQYIISQRAKSEDSANESE